MQYEFSDCWLDTDTREFVRNGLPNNLEPQVFDLLVLLLENRSRIISREELIQTIWSRRIVSDATIDARISAARSAVGDSGAKQKIIKTAPRKGFRFIAELTIGGNKNCPETKTHSPPVVTDEIRNAQRVRYCFSQDKTRIGYATTGHGIPLVRTGHWLTHLEHDWQSPIWHPFLDTLGESFSVTRYDQRGNGLSDWQLREFSLDKCVEDLEAVVEASGLERFVLYGSSQGAPISIAYAARHPKKVSHLILHGGFVRGRMVRSSVEEVAQGEAILTLIRHGWGKPGGAFIKGFASFFIPDSTQEQIDSLVDLQQKTTNANNAVIIRSVIDHFDISALLNQISVPTLVIHARNDSVQPLEQGQSIAAGIKDAEFVMLESSNHVILEQEPAWQVLFSEIRRFAQNE
jgi:pimeloyl-ACP methyl ester carboxylesterase/DNA-binding winged helix-turn-helix (wHTH) protein